MNTFYETYFCDDCNRFSKMEKQGGYFAPLFKPIENLLTNLFSRPCPKCGGGNIHKVTSRNVLKDNNWISSQSYIIDERLKTMKTNITMVTIMSVIDILAILSCAVLWWFPTFINNASWWMWIIIVFSGYLLWGCLSYMSPSALLSICNFIIILICAYSWWFPSFFGQLVWWGWILVVLGCGFLAALLSQANIKFLLSSNIFFILIAAVMAFFN